MENQDISLTLLLLHGMGKDDIKQHWFSYEVIWSVNKIIDEASKNVQLETTLMDRALMWYMNYKDTTLMGHMR